jgi:hypothetical protein
MSDDSNMITITEAQSLVREHFRRPMAKKGVHDWSKQPRTMVDPPETYEPSRLRHIVTVLGMTLAFAFFAVCAVLGGLLLARAVHDAMAMGWSWSVVLESISDRLGPA